MRGKWETRNEIFVLQISLNSTVKVGSLILSITWYVFIQIVTNQKLTYTSNKDYVLLNLVFIKGFSCHEL